MPRRHHGPSFFARVYHVVGLIPHGQVATYGQVASIIGDPHAARTVGWALNKLPEGKGVPWHRVINAQGRISPRRYAGAVSEQRQLLEHEGIVFDAEGTVDLERYQWEGLDWPDIEELERGWAAEPPGHRQHLGE
jgi:methylated-DNA-protein-cysteine methyltransferase-like protein